MKKILHSVSLALAGAALLTACSRPVATFQKSQPERFYSQQKTTVPVQANEEVVTPIVDVPVVASTEAIAAAPAPQIQEASVALASLKTTHAADRRLTKRIERAEKMLADVNQPATTKAVSSLKKVTGMQRTMLKSIDKKIQKHLSPKDTNAFTGYIRIGAIVALIGLLLLLIGNGVGATIGLLALIAGLILILLGVIDQG
jgi:PBP1b-binding outer membrane lipoprotein LpoB